MFKNLRKKYKYINGTKGVIALFLAIIMLPFGMIAGILINASRIDSAVAIFDEALCNASNSTLGTYDSFLRTRFGLLALDQETSSSGKVDQKTTETFIKKTFDYYMEQNLGTLSNTFFDYTSEVSGVYPLADNNVMLAEILNCSRYSVPTKLVEDAIDISDIVKKIEERLKPAKTIISVVTGGVDIATGFFDLTDDLELLQDAIDEEDIAFNKYVSKYNAFESAVTDYVNTINRLKTEINTLEKKVETESEKLGDIGEQILQLEEEIAALKKEEEEAQVDYSEDIKELEEQLSQIESENETSIKVLDNTNKELQKKKASFSTIKAEKENKIIDARDEYATSISELSYKMKNVYPKLKSVQSDIISLSSGIGSEVANTGKIGIEKAQKEQKEAISQKEKDLTAAINSGATYETINTIRNELSTMKKELTNTDNAKTVLEAEKTGFLSAIAEGKRTLDKANVELYSESADKLTQLKELVNNYKVDCEYINKSEYFIEFNGRITASEMRAMTDSMASVIAKQSIWAIVKALASFIKALFNVALVYDPDLAAIIDTGYYKDANGGLPSARPQSLIQNSFTQDAEKSQEFKDLYGSYTVSNGTSLLSFDFFGLIGTAMSDLSIILNDINQIISFIGLFKITKLVKEIYDKCCDLVNTIVTIINNFSNIINSISEKILLTGYLTYMTSNRSTYTGNNLLGKPFNTRKQETTNRNGTGIGLIDSFTELISMAKDGGKGNTKKCFVGAETEYLINGSKNEIANQSAVFLYLYAIRLIANIYTVFSNPEVAEIAAASTLAAPIIYMLYIFIEPLSDCVLLVNNGKTDFIKSTPNLVVSGFGSYVSDILLLELSDAEITSANEKLITALGANEDYAKKHTEIHGTDWSSTGGGENKKRSFGFDYTNYMILMLSFTSSDNLIKRFSDIVEMEATENLSNVVNTSGQFNLNYSYTYVRAKANFSTNNFITISGNNKLRMKEVTVYKGY